MLEYLSLTITPTREEASPMIASMAYQSRLQPRSHPGNEVEPFAIDLKYIVGDVRPV